MARGQGLLMEYGNVQQWESRDSGSVGERERELEHYHNCPEIITGAETQELQDLLLGDHSSISYSVKMLSASLDLLPFCDTNHILT